MGFYCGQLPYCRGRDAEYVSMATEDFSIVLLLSRTNYHDEIVDDEIENISLKLLKGHLKP